VSQSKACSACGKLYLSEQFLQRHVTACHPHLLQGAAAEGRPNLEEFLAAEEDFEPVVGD
jgi:hypothetical protein